MAGIILRTGNSAGGTWLWEKRPIISPHTTEATGTASGGAGQ